MKKRVAVIGAGPSGIAQLRAFAAAERSGAEVPDVVCFERQADWGGQWNYTWRAGTDEYGEPVHSSIYRHLWSNGPKERIEFADYSFDEHFGRPLSSFPPREVLWDYINGRIERSGVRDKVRFSTAVRHVEYDRATETFTLEAENLLDRSTTVEEFDEVVVASGHYSVPHSPGFEGLETFPGLVQHAHDFRGAEHLVGKDLLVVGGSSSAEDIALQAYKMGTKSVTITYRSKEMGYAWPETVEERPLLTRMEGRTAYFADGTSKEFDAVVLCTGYIHSFPFMSHDIRLNTTGTLYVDHLYKGVTLAANPKVHYLGMQHQWFTFTMFDIQAWYVRDVVLGRVDLPDEATMRADIAAWQDRRDAREVGKGDPVFQADMLKEILAVTDYPDIDLDAVVNLFLAWKQSKKDEVTTYRDQVYRSIVTGTMSVPQRTAWLDMLDDTAAGYLADLTDPVEEMGPGAALGVAAAAEAAGDAAVGAAAAGDAAVGAAAGAGAATRDDLAAAAG
ncbi:NAD(P)/FAD-dependent oxidoreductase [Brevibacterium litoralis]|uniref:NAD(P)/FAD-dependent oxidoreductase n=1 Tax=Brevibacterium litoralis TaxID=3138935 RepID=UPI0032EC3E15